MVITIYDKIGRAKAEVSPNDSSTQVKEIQGDNELSLSFVHCEYIALDVDDWVDFEGERYWLTERYRPKEISTMQWQYDLKLYGVESMIKNILVIKRVDGEDDPVFTLTAPPAEHVRMIVDCMNDGMGNITDWKVGQVEGTENIVIDYHGKYCNEALAEIAEKVGAEWWVEGQTVNICRCEHGDPVALGYDNGLTGIDADKADNVKFYTRLYPVGSSRNIDPEKYGFSRLHLPGGRKYVEINADRYGRVDHYEDSAFADIYPRRVGEVSSVRHEVRKGDDGEPFTIWYFKDKSLNFDPNDYEIGGLVKRVSFQEGSELGGLGDEDNGTYYFEVNFDSRTKEFEIITIWPYDDGTQLPGVEGSAFVPSPGDKYILWNLRMPDEYYALAEAEFLEAVNRYNEEHALDISVFKASTDHVWIEDNKVDLFVGRRVRLESRQYFPETWYRDSRITRITRKVNLPSSMDIEIGDALSRTSQQKMSDSISDARSYAKSIGDSLTLPDIIRTGDNTRPTDNNLFSARRIEKSYLSKVNPDKAKEKITFEKGIEAGDYIEGQKGAAVDGDGRAEVESLKVRGSAEFMELVYNRLNAIEGNTEFAESGSIDAVDHVGGLVYRLTMRRRWEGDFTAFQANDIIYGYVNRLDDSGTFYKVWAWVQSVDRDANALQVCMYAGADVPGGVNGLFEPGMIVSRRGNRTDKERQRSFCISTTDGNIIELTGVDRPVVTRANYGMVLGRLPEGLVPESVAAHMIDGLPYLYARGIIVQDILRMDYQGNIAQEKQLTVWGIRNAAVVNMNVATPLTTVVVERTRGGEFMQITDQLMLEADGVHLEISIDDGDWRLYFLGETSPLITEAGEMLTTESGEVLTGGDARLPFAEMMRSIDLRLVDVDGTVLAESRAVAVYDGSDGLDGKDGLPGEKGDPGKDGSDGARGAILRGPQDWESLPTGYAFQAGGEGEEFKDFVVYKGEYYSCTAGHVKTALTPVDGSTTTPKLWQLSDRIEMVATQILLAKYALVKNLGVERVQTVGEKASIDIHDGMIEVFGQYCCNIRFGVNDDGYAVLEYYDNAGKFLYDLGPEGISQVARNNSYWDTLYLMRTHSADKTAEEVRNAFKSSALIYDSTNYGTYYRYHAGSTILADINDGKIFTMKDTASAFIADGWYKVESGSAFVENPFIETDSSLIPVNPNFGGKSSVTLMQITRGVCRQTIIVYKSN